MDKRVIALGFFDGVHRGHGALLRAVAAHARELNASPAALLFEEHPQKVIGGKLSLINTTREREFLMRKLYGINDVVHIPFDDALRHMNWEVFAREVLVNKLCACYTVAGYNYRFGYMGNGTPELLNAVCPCDIIPPVMQDGTPISSTRIRALIENGNMRRAEALLGHPHIIISPVMAGNQLGRTLGIPTINQHFESGILVPRLGVYSSRVCVDGMCYKGVTNIGVRPTVETSAAPRAETHIIGFDGNLYGREVELQFVDFLRPELRFSSVLELKTQIEHDIEATKNAPA
ncbi:MAG: riboflavin biosynthesis protein RibF [Clostridia bacterium]